MIKSLIFALLIAFSVVACATNTSLYYWGDYPKSSVNYAMKSADKEYTQKHIEELRKVIETSDSQKRRVAPGLYAEYGQLLYENEQRNEARKFFELEKTTYPESEVFINRIVSKLYSEN
ncbi:MAG: DUF4810 domain-containing protein [Geovibrio sp.]|uniref:DUF4810 domain-containing protein n=1 Tax=Geovibrio thiophilus TaxID=139438 RepID=A0A410JZT2_9BACT|nr:DUF4810 domain-containing protein [Geovibrio thiophilus]MCD8569584.1 DUF4810 domain-containing protein [Geovibrio sp.]QAR33682.1 DUF4810 domain-containing protein [Geovibrio thiophilus]